MTTQLERLRAYMAAGDWHRALRLAAGWARLGEHREVIQRGWAAMVNPQLYREMGQDPDALVAAGIAALRARYGV